MINTLLPLTFTTTQRTRDFSNPLSRRLLRTRDKSFPQIPNQWNFNRGFSSCGFLAKVLGATLSYSVSSYSGFLACLFLSSFMHLPWLFILCATGQGQGGKCGCSQTAIPSPHLKQSQQTSLFRNYFYIRKAVLSLGSNNHSLKVLSESW